MSSFFEGAEKLLEIWFDNPGDEGPPPDLRVIPKNVWDSILKMVKCEIISFKRYDEIDAYVLSESSMFISRNRFIIKTCGNTSLLECLEPVLYVAKDVAGFEDVLDVFFSRKNFLRPELQPKLHSNFALETEALDSFFEEGAAYCMGRMNRDHWYLYTMNPAIPTKGVCCPDQTLEVMMMDLDQKIMRIFSKAVCRTGPEATIKSGIDKLIPGAAIDEFLFEPCGYSMNGYIKGGYYMTIHITPEPGFSYVSFETNYPQTSYVDLIGRLLKTFNPGQFIITLMTNESSISANSNKLDYKPDSYHAYQRKELQFARVKNYELTYGLFAKAPS